VEILESLALIASFTFGATVAFLPQLTGREHRSNIFIDIAGLAVWLGVMTGALWIVDPEGLVASLEPAKVQPKVVHSRLDDWWEEWTG
jgi:hypothetical protein